MKCRTQFAIAALVPLCLLIMLRVCVCVFAHLLSCSILIYSISIWSLKDPLFAHALELAGTYRRRGVDADHDAPFPTYNSELPVFRSSHIHNGFIDSLRWYGDCIVSKSTKNNIVLWAPDAIRFIPTDPAKFEVRRIFCPALLHWCTLCHILYEVCRNLLRCILLCNHCC